VAEVSVVIPAFNSAGKLARAVESVRHQTHTEWDLVVVDDGGDEDLDWLEQLRDPRIVLLRQPNRGVSVARNVGVSVSSAPYVAFLDQDDEWLPDKLARQMSLMHQVDANFSFTDFYWVSDDIERPSGPVDMSYPMLLGGSQHICLSSAVVSREAYERVGGHDPLLSQMQDYDLFLKLLLLEEPTAHVAEHLVRYRLHAANASSDYETALAEALGILRSHRRRAILRGDHAALEACRAGLSARRKLFGAKAYDAGRAGVRAGDASAVEHLARAVRLSPGPTLQAVGLKAISPVRRLVRR
jgi:glycosyltransferase involved in cell wall biosynthesis